MMKVYIISKLTIFLKLFVVTIFFGDEMESFVSYIDVCLFVNIAY